MFFKILILMSFFINLYQIDFAYSIISAKPPSDAQKISATIPKITNPLQDSNSLKSDAKKQTQRAIKSFKFFSNNLGYSQSPKNWGSQIIYQIQMDRFNDGDSSNNFKNLPEPQKKGDLSQLMNFRHGGDLLGVMQRLPYLKNLGVTSLWLTPIFEHDGSYHGYCTTNFYKIDPGFGSKELFRNLVKKAHEMGIRIILDVVINHFCDKETDYAPIENTQFDHQKCTEDLSQNDPEKNSFTSDHQGNLNFSNHFFKYFKNQKFFNRCGPNTKSEMQGLGPASVYGDFVKGMFDFNTHDPEFRSIFSEVLKYWIAYADIDGYRLDAAKHVTEDFVATLSTELRDFSSSIGKQNFFIVGEIAGPPEWIGRRLGRMRSAQFTTMNDFETKEAEKSLSQKSPFIPSELQSLYLKHSFFPFPGLNAVFDFAHGGNAEGVLHNARPTKSLSDYFESDYYHEISIQGDSRLSWNLLEIHDWPRFSSYFPKSLEKSKLGAAYLALAEGSPVIYYGFEQGFNGQCPSNVMSSMNQACLNTSDDAFFRQDMFIHGPFRLGSTVPSIQKLAGITETDIKNSKSVIKNSYSKDPYLDEENELFQWTRKLLHLRKSCKALSSGKTVFRLSEPSTEGLFAFSRLDESSPRTNPRREILIVINTGSKPRLLSHLPIETPSHLNSGIWINVLNPKEKGTVQTSSEVSSNSTKDDNRTAQLALEGMTIHENSVMVFIPSEALGPYKSKLGISLCQ